MVATILNSLAAVALDLLRPFFASVDIPTPAFLRLMFIPNLDLLGHKQLRFFRCILKLYFGFLV